MIEGISGRNDNEMYIGNRMDSGKTHFNLHHERHCILFLTMRIICLLFKTCMDYEQ